MKVELTESVLLAIELVSETIRRVFKRSNICARLGITYIKDEGGNENPDEYPLRRLNFTGKIIGVPKQMCRDEFSATVNIWKNDEEPNVIREVIAKVACNGWEYLAWAKPNNGEFQVHVKIDPTVGNEIYEFGDVPKEVDYLHPECPQRFDTMPSVSPNQFPLLYGEVVALLRKYSIKAEIKQQNVGSIRFCNTGDHYTHSLHLDLHCNEAMADPNFKPKPEPKFQTGLTGK